MATQSSSAVLNRALAVAEHPHAVIQAVGPAAESKRSLLGLMNNKVRFIIFVAIALPAALAMQAGLGSFTTPSAPTAESPPISQTQSQDSASAQALAGANRSAAVIMAIKKGVHPAAVSAPAALAPAAVPPVSAAKKAPVAPAAPAALMASHVPSNDVLARALPNQGEGMDSYGIARALVKVDLFAALAAAVEDFKPKPYYDPGGLNVGFGYCISKRKAEYGEARIRADLTAAGFEPRQVESLLKDKKSEVAKIKVSPLQAVRLLEITKPDYESIASGAVGEKTFVALPENTRAMLTHLAYNTGNVAQFTSLVKAIRKNDPRQAVLNMNVTWRGLDGVVHTNTRLQAWLGAMRAGVPTFERALKNPMAFEGHIANPDGVQALAHLAEGNERLAAAPPDMAKNLARITQKLLSRNTWAVEAYRETTDKHLTGKPAPS